MKEAEERMRALEAKQAEEANLKLQEEAEKEEKRLMILKKNEEMMEEKRSYYLDQLSEKDKKSYEAKEKLRKE